MQNLTYNTLHLPSSPQTPSTPTFDQLDQEQSSKHTSRRTLFDLEEEYIIHKNPIFKRRLKSKQNTQIDYTTFLGRNLLENEFESM
ncbi:unnamed protein product (macronuclear) [Paramecium tetraurelia]|uniref:Uncharacterized protein n=1 Tax=Paramecium tetraurelia TaxID=5888 RepID=A0D7D6_PARTE|nr:uncharacterized protein GSPATT00001995001 [Paramecium tetraurelia]CAK78953.1 unnamed protein product [Paramecium tetraurelia]|eukprot:XP_001446350.1 hypothetical protein (macronuclear) [Paramecium tetraurelia strain d4-2]